MQCCKKRTAEESSVVQKSENNAKVKYDILMLYLEIKEEKYEKKKFFNDFNHHGNFNCARSMDFCAMDFVG